MIINACVNHNAELAFKNIRCIIIQQSTGKKTELKIEILKISPVS